MKSKLVILNIFTNLVLQVIVILYGFIVPKIIISNYGSNVNGLISSITQFLAYIALLDSGFTAVVKSQLYKPIVEKNNEEISSILKSSDAFFKKIAYIFIIYICILSVAYPFFVNNTFDFIYTFSLVIILSISSFFEYFFGMVYRMYLQAEQKSYVISIIQIITYIVTIIITIFLSKINVSIQFLKLFTSFAFLLRPLMQAYYVKKNFNIDLKNIPKQNKYKIKNKWDGFAQHIASVIHNNTDIAVLTIFCSLSEVSVYSVYYLVIKGIKSIIQSFTHSIDSSFGYLIASNDLKKLNKSFRSYETLYNIVAQICFISAMILIIPFVTIYTNNVYDVNYIRPVFGILIIISEYIWAIRQPYNEIVKAAGHFKQTKIGSYIECIVNIVLSIILVLKYGIIGTIIATIIAMSIRTIELIYYVNKNILKRNIKLSIINVLLNIFITIVCLTIFDNIPFFGEYNYFNLLLNAILDAIIITFIILIINITFNRSELNNIFKLFKNKFNKMRRLYDKKND